ncbi:hypothetical protein [Aureivirga marina]|uniref:hypothetical protein n=1 Tax=Aureivirga marina TaxID=1182451 RepID=UPI0018CADC52|nr:hypothetical protein [Aureivirga marina]
MKDIKIDYDRSVLIENDFKLKSLINKSISKVYLLSPSGKKTSVLCFPSVASWLPENPLYIHVINENMIHLIIPNIIMCSPELKDKLIISSQ